MLEMQNRQLRTNSNIDDVIEKFGMLGSENEKFAFDNYFFSSERRGTDFRQCEERLNCQTRFGEKTGNNMVEVLMAVFKSCPPLHRSVYNVSIYILYIYIYTHGVKNVEN